MTVAHLDHEVLADLAEGILDEAASASADAHLSVCPECRDRAAEVAEVSRILAEAPHPPMPDHLMARLDAVLAAEAAAYVPGDRRARRYQFLAAAAAAVVMVGGGGYLTRVVMSGDGDARRATVGQAPVEEPRPAGARPRSQGVRPDADRGPASGRRYTSASLASQVAVALSGPSTAGSRPPGAPGGPDAALDACVGRVRAGKTPLLVDAASYDGRPATVIVLPDTDAHHADVWVVGARCSGDRTDLIAHLRIVR